MTHQHGQQFALIQTAGGDVVLAVDDISHALPVAAPDVHPAFGEQQQEVYTRVHFKAHGSTFIDLPGITPKGLASALNGAPF